MLFFLLVQDISDQIALYDPWTKDTPDLKKQTAANSWNLANTRSSNEGNFSIGNTLLLDLSFKKKLLANTLRIQSATSKTTHSPARVYGACNADKTAGVWRWGVRQRWWGGKGSYELDIFSVSWGVRESPVVDDGWTQGNMLSWLTGAGSCWTHTGVGLEGMGGGKQLEGFPFGCSQTRMMHLACITSAMGNSS